VKRLRHAWARLDDEALLDVRLCDLRLRLAGTAVQARITRLYGELALAVSPFVRTPGSRWTGSRPTGCPVSRCLSIWRIRVSRAWSAG